MNCCCEHELLHKLNRKMEALMAQVDDLNEKLDAVGTALDGVATGLTTLKTDLDKTLADLAAKIAALPPTPTVTDLTVTLAKAQALSDKIAPIAAAVSGLDTEAVAADA